MTEHDLPPESPSNDTDSATRGTQPSPYKTTRRRFLRGLSYLSLTIPGVGAALSSCSPSRRWLRHIPGVSAALAAAGENRAQPRSLLDNPDSTQDKELEREGHAATSLTGEVPSSVRGIEFRRYDPVLPPPPDQGVLDVHFHSREAPIRISPSTVVAGWTFEGNIPAPILHCRVGDTVNFKLTNDSYIPHSMDFHAAQINPASAFRSVPYGESVSYSFKPRYAGAFMYHCGTAPVLMHIGTGMYGAIVVSPREPLPSAREFVLVQSEYYLGKAVHHIRPFDYAQMLSVAPDYVVFNGRPQQYMQKPIRVQVGERVRFWVVNAGPTLPCAFHVVGEQFDTVYIGEPPDNVIHGVQTFDVPAGCGMGFELVCAIPGTFAFVNHAFGHGQKGAIGYLVVEES